MFKDIKILGKETAIYGLSTIVARLLNFLLLPFYTYYLSTAEYGIVAAVFSFIAFLNIIYQYGMDQAYMRFSVGSVDKKMYFSTAFWVLSATSCIFSSIIFFASGYLSLKAGIGIASSGIVRYAALVLALDAVSVVAFAELRLSHRPWKFVSARIVSIIVNVLMNVVLLSRFKTGPEGVFIASAAASCVALFMVGDVLKEYVRPLFSGQIFKDMIKFGLPFLPAGLGAMAVQVIDRPILLKLTDESTVGIYQANYRLGIFMMLIVSMFDQAWRPFFMERASKPDAGRVLSRILTYFTVLGIFCVLLLSVLIPELVTYRIAGKTLIHPAYWSGLGIVPIVLCGYLFYGMYINFMAPVMISKKTGMLAWVTFLGAAVNIAANFLFIPGYGMYGAAFATLAAYVVMALALYAVGSRCYPLPYEYGRLSYSFFCGILCACGIYFSPLFLFKILSAALYPVLLYITGFFTKEELGILKK